MFKKVQNCAMCCMKYLWASQPGVIFLLWNANEEEKRLKDSADEVQRLGVVGTLGRHVDQQLGKRKRLVLRGMSRKK
jgi:hypothetical protein